jgi:hypothetical protein
VIANLIDHRANPFNPHVHAVFEPACHDNARTFDGTEFFPWDEAVQHPDYFIVQDQPNTTVREAIMRAERDWAIPVTVFVYDCEAKPLG